MCAFFCRWAYYKIHACVQLEYFTGDKRNTLSARLQMRLRMWARASLKFEPRRMEAPTRFVIPMVRAETEPKGCSQKKGKGGGIILAQEKYTHSHARVYRRIMQIRSQRSPGPCAVRQRFLRASCVRATFLPVIHVVCKCRRRVGLADSPSAFCCLEVAVCVRRRLVGDSNAN